MTPDTKMHSRWRLVRLGELCRVQNGFPFKSGFFNEHRGVPLVRVRSLKTQSCDLRYKGDFDPAFLVKDGDVLIGMDGDFQPCYWKGGAALLNQRVCRLVQFSDQVDPYFVYEALKSPLRRVEETTHYTTVKHISSYTIQDIELSIPPLVEQRTIAQVLRAVQESKDARERELALERERKAALMEYLFTHGTRGEPKKETDIGAFPESWHLTRLGEVARIGNGSTPKRSDEKYWKGGTVPWITSTQIHDVVIEHANELVTETARRECHLPLVPSGSIVVAITGQGKTLGNAAILAIDTCINQHLAYIGLERASVHAQFVLVYLQSKYSYLRGVALGGGSTKGALTCGFLKSMSIPVPSLDEQIAISDALLGCDKKRKCLEGEVGLLEDLFRALLEELMTGRLSATTLIEEPQPR
jgi:type I restriction enzyme S subunit